MKRKFLFALVLVVSTITGVFADIAKAQAPPRRIEITAKRFGFDPGEITLKKGQPVVLVLKSSDVSHGLRFRELNIDVKVKAHSQAEVQLTPDKTGDFIGHCDVFCGSGHGSMMLTIHVVE